MTAAVTGARGYLGLNLVRALVERGEQVVAIDRQPSRHLKHERVRWVVGDILDDASMRTCLKDVDTVYHLATAVSRAAHDDTAWRINTEGVRTVGWAAACSGVARFVHCSTVQAFDQHRIVGLLDEDAPGSTDPRLPAYHRSMHAGEREVRQLVERGLDAVICNPTTVYGPVEYGLSRVNSLLRDAAAGHQRVAAGGGIDLVDARDVAAGLILAASLGRTGENYLLSGHPVAMIDALRLAARVVGRRGPAFSLPMRPIRALLPVLTPISHVYPVDELSQAGALLAAPIVDGSKASRELGYQPRQSVTTIRELVEFLVESGQLTPAERTGVPQRR